MQTSASFLRQLSNDNNKSIKSKYYCSAREEMRSKRVMVVVDETSHSKHALIWALTHLVHHSDLLTLLHIIPSSSSSCSSSHLIVDSLGSLCKSCKPEVEVEALVVQGPKLETVISQVKKLDVSVLVLGQKKCSSFTSCLSGSSMSNSEELVEECILSVERCTTVGVRKQSKGKSGYLITTKWQKNFWLLA
ncbi:hypothetical protein LINGRAHAP2_LOCUS17542 [Linum grandiflorum]